jgi:two-component system OmpR family sensor kinase
MMPKTLFGKLSIAMFLLFLVVGGSFLHSALKTAYLYQQEVSQRLNRDLAMYIVEEQLHFNIDGTVNNDAIRSLFQNVMIINPSLELYLLDSEGNITAHSVESKKIVNKQISLEPIRQFLSGDSTLPLFGQDPKSSGISKVFSAAPIDYGNETYGYVYAVLGSEQFDNINELIQQSYIVREGMVTLVLSLLFAFSGGIIIIFLLTRRLRKLSNAMEAFRNMDHETEQLETRPVSGSDEISVMTDTFQRMAKQIETQLAQMKETDALRRELVANVSHDLRTPLATMQGYIETLILKNDSLQPSERLQFLETTQRSSERLNKLVTELFELAKLDAGELKLHYEQFSVAELMHDVMQKFRLRAEKHGLALKVEINTDSSYVSADIGLIERVLDNLVDNAIKNTPAGGKITLSIDSRNGKVTVSVKDTGRGIPEKDLDNIFQRFYKRPADDEHSTGAGLGLAIAQRIVELHGSELKVASAVNQGTSFDFSLTVAA